MSEWKLVPVEPTGKMVAAGSWGAAAGMRDSDVMELWRDMVGAAPSPWIPCSERMPEDMAVVLAWSPGHDWPFDVQYRAGVGFVDLLASRCGEGWYKIRATHWTPLPAPPSEGGAG